MTTTAPRPLFADAADRAEVVGQAVGAGSVCWEKVEAAGVFDSDGAKVVVEDALARLAELDQPLLGLATTRELLDELYTRFRLAAGLTPEASELTMEVADRDLAVLAERAAFGLRTVRDELVSSAASDGPGRRLLDDRTADR